MNHKPSGLEDKNGSPEVCSGCSDRPYKVLLPLKGQGEKKTKQNQTNTKPSSCIVSFNLLSPISLMAELCRGAGVWAAERYQLCYACNPGFCHCKGKRFISSLMENNNLIPGLFLLPCHVSLEPLPGSEVGRVLCSSLVFFQLSPFHLPDDKGTLQNTV